ncbi:MAG TPA: hypothetical protein VK184_09535 [Nostocaceae cyanobacterium]|nr:hypothetical protein [Nostocaceae cyanobacterium]
MNELKPRKSGSGGYRPGAGRKRKDIKTVKIKINSDSYEKLRSHIQALLKAGGKKISIQDYCSKKIIQYYLEMRRNEEAKAEIVAEIQSFSEPWSITTITEIACEKLDEIIEIISPLTQLYCNRSNTMTVILLKSMQHERITLLNHSK